jgi:hypothetical protein
MKIEKIKGEDVGFDLSFNNFNILEFCFRNTLNELYDDHDFLNIVWWHLFDIDREQVASEKGEEDTRLTVTMQGETKEMSVQEVDFKIILAFEKLSKIIYNNKKTFNEKMILFGDE